MKKLSYLIIGLLMVSLVSCKKEFFDINENPNSPTANSITPELLLPRSLHLTAARMSVSMDYAAHWTGYWARGGNYGPTNPQEDYAITNDYQAGQWSGWYDLLFDVDLMEKKGTALNQPFYTGIAKVLKSIGFMYLVDQYNNVPYSKAFDLTNNILPSYDKGDAIYADLISQLDTAVTIFKSITPANLSDNKGIASADIVYKGVAANWIKFANTQRLKLILRQSQVSGFNGAAEVAKIVTNGGGFIDAGQTANVQPVYVVDNGKQNPFWNAYKTLYTGAVADDYNRANNYVLGRYEDNNDVRYQYFFSKATTVVSGNTYYGYNFGEILPSSDPFKSINSSDVAGPGLAKSAGQPQWFFTSVESLFLQAEAIQRGWLTGDAKTAYENAVKESFAYLGVTNAASTYLASGLPIVDWASSTNKINLIAMQQYLALTGINNFEAYSNYRRLGVPTDLPMSLAPGRSGRVIPKRLLYPTSEYNYNAEAVKAEGTIDAQTSTVFWDK
ncbi:SusD/RagB family nutrient-binding outer membrane lipoprotein [Sphingobacterium bovistauri]|uniref:SusD/RagB family nutrient-binding outer membrane lipoprotein n=1 Tax=Sphingobacterium bovistauri TaxID=2781959 RepID=A0ABS7Z4M8_9SPHI|nr:SusD/RagB family nutrient-binding outer membrane lipoprotein [Sphingobacterium bovistauri]MCA5004346.1 SusD/RagB family nutrient-binding outer membrane lipoprotein [Sphingobacterium bovistauri]